ncbi:MAG: hypothetical protein KIT54_03515 [Phycisphaeraceae bacterium]|nr:hypothetical protein [Phycisphaeraceae bacterium]
MKNEVLRKATLEPLRCPISRLPLEWDESGQWVNVVGQPRRYPVKDGIPILVEHAAQTTDSTDVAASTR